MMTLAIPRPITEQVGKLCWRTARCAFVISTGRVGTQSCIELLNCSPLVEAHHEPLPRRRTLAKQAYADVWDDPGKYERAFVAARGGRLGWAHLRGRVYAEATNMIYLSPTIAGLLPRAKFIHLHRHPGDFVRSGMRRGWYGPHPWDRYRLEPLPGDPFHALWPRWGPFERICFVWRAVNEFILRFSESVGPGRCLNLPFAQLMNAEAGGFSELFEFLGLPLPDEAVVRRTLGRRHNEQKEGEFPHYRDWSAAQRDTLRRIAGPIMDALGYA